MWMLKKLLGLRFSMHVSSHPLVVLFRNGRGRITSPVAHLLISPLSAQFIVSYPRSGSTWMRTMLVNVLDPNSKSDPAVFNRVIPGCTLTRLWDVYHAPSPRILSTHSTYRRNIKRAVYIARNGRDSILSLFRYTTVRVGLNMEFSKWFALYMKGCYGPRWDQHVVSWLTKGRKKLGKDMLVVRYEDCCAHPHDVLSNVCDFLGVRHTQSDIQRAIELSSIKNMRKWERKYVGEIKDENASFYRGKKINDEWNNLLTEEQRNKFLTVSGEALRLGGYI